MESLTNEQKRLAWEAGWHPSFDGIAIVNKDFTFRYVNPQWLELMGSNLTPADFIGKSFVDITAPQDLKVDMKNANLLIKGKISSYVMRKQYKFLNGEQKDVILLVNRVPKNPTHPFQFFLSRIILNPDAENIIHSKQSSLMLMFATWGNIITKYSGLLISIGLIIGGAIVAVLKAVGLL
jgi:PAS domain S-box-containing protein